MERERDYGRLEGECSIGGEGRTMEKNAQEALKGVADCHSFLVVSVAPPAEPRGEKKLFFVQILGGEKLLRFVEKCR